MPKKSKLCLVEFLPSDNKNLAYCVPEEMTRIYRYIALYEGSEDLRQALIEQSGFYADEDPKFVDWAAGRRSDLDKEVADVVLLAGGSVTRLRSNLERGLQEVRRVLKEDGRVLIVLEADEVGVLGDLDFALDAAMSSQVVKEDLLSRCGLELARVVQDPGDSGLAIAVCFKSQKAGLVEARRAKSASGARRSAAAKASSSAPAAPAARAGQRVPSGRPAGKQGGRGRSKR